MKYTNPNKRVLTGITAGSFDLCHPGHLIMFKQARNLCNELIVCLQTDPSVDRPGVKRKPVESVYERYVRLDSCKYVDKIIPYTTEEELLNIFKTVDFDMRFLDEEYSGRTNFTGYEETKERIVYTPRKHSWSSTSLRDRIMEEVKDLGKD